MADSNDLNDLEKQTGMSTEMLAETENYLLWRAKEPDGEITYHLDVDMVTLHFYEEEWQEFAQLVQTALGKPDKSGGAHKPAPNERGNSGSGGSRPRR